MCVFIIEKDCEHFMIMILKTVIVTPEIYECYCLKRGIDTKRERTVRKRSVCDSPPKPVTKLNKEELKPFHKLANYVKISLICK